MTHFCDGLLEGRGKLQSFLCLNGSKRCGEATACGIDGIVQNEKLRIISEGYSRV